MPGSGGPSQVRRRARRAAARAEQKKAGEISNSYIKISPVVADATEPESLIDWDALREYAADAAFAASGSSSLPLSDRDASWDAGAAEKSLDPAQFSDAHFWKDPDGEADQIGSYKLPFAQVVDGKLTAIWKGVTGAAAAIQGARGGVKIPDDDVSGVKAKIAAYYAKAAKQYDDDDIKTPWSADADDAETFADTPMTGDCADCGHAATAHYGETNSGKCSMDNCDCMGFKIAAAIDLSEITAAGDVVWDPEDGFQDLISDINYLLNPSGDWDFPMYAWDVSTDSERTLISNWDDGTAWIAPITIGDDKEPSLSGRAEWMKVEQAWVESDDEFAVKLRASMANRTLVRENMTAGSGTTTITLGDFTITGGEGFIVTADGATNPDIPDKHQTKETLPPRRADAAINEEGDEDDPDEDVDAPESTDDDKNDDAIESGIPATGMSWVATIVPEGAPTDDGRIFAPGATTWREPPLSLGAMFDTPHADVVTASPVVGRIDNIWREGDMVYASGIFDDSDLGRDVARMVSDGTLRGISVDIAVSKMEIAWKSEILDADGNWKGGDGPSGEDGPSLADILFDPDPDDQVMYVVWEGKIGAVTICPFPAFAEANIKPASSIAASAQSELVWTVSKQSGMTIVAQKAAVVASAATEDETSGDAPEALVASVSAPLEPPVEWFYEPELPELTTLTITDDGRIYGHAAPWDTCHIGIPGVCQTAPRSHSDYAYFHLKEVECETGEKISCGTLTFGTGHAGRGLGRIDAAAHYDNTGTAVADIVCGEDDHGIFYTGALRPDLDEKTIRALRGAAVSGDWRNVNGDLEFVALLAVNVPGFPVPKPRANMIASADDGFEIMSLVAAGIHAGQEGLTRLEAAQFDALREEMTGGWDDLAASLEES